MSKRSLRKARRSRRAQHRQRNAIAPKSFKTFALRGLEFNRKSRRAMVRAISSSALYFIDNASYERIPSDVNMRVYRYKLPKQKPLKGHPHYRRRDKALRKDWCCTGRLRESEPAAQNIPIRSKLGSEIRGAMFCATTIQSKGGFKTKF